MKRLFCSAFSFLLMASACSQVEVEDSPVEANLRSLAYYETELAEAWEMAETDDIRSLVLPPAEEPNPASAPYK